MEGGVLLSLIERLGLSPDTLKIAGTIVTLLGGMVVGLSPRDANRRLTWVGWWAIVAMFSGAILNILITESESQSRRYT